MKKRILALVCAVVMTVGMSLTVSAAGSNTASSTASDAAQYENMSEASLSTATQTFDHATIQSFAKTTTIKSGVKGATVNPVMAVTVPEAIKAAKEQVNANAFIAAIVDIKADAPGTYTIACPNVWAGQKVYILHEVKTGVWEKIVPTNVGNNEVTFDLNSYSTIAIVIDTTVAKTADVAPIVATMAVVCLAGAVVFGRKKAAN